MEFKFKYGLKDASSFLKKLKSEKLYQLQNDQQTVHEKTFGQQQFSLSKNSPDPAPDKNIQSEGELCSKIQQQPLQISQMLVLEHMKKTLAIYENDLQQLKQNRHNIVEAIEQLATKIQGITDLHTKNQNLELDNYRQRKDIEEMIKEYHRLKLELISKENKLVFLVNRKKQKLKKLFELLELRVQDRVQIESWQQYYHQLQTNKYQINQIVTNKEGPTDQPIEDQIVRNIFGKKAEANQVRTSKKQIKMQNKGREGLLGDLKSFSKNFKMP